VCHLPAGEAPALEQAPPPGQRVSLMRRVGSSAWHAPVIGRKMRAVGKNFVAQPHALRTDVDARTRDQALHLILAFAAKRADKLSPRASHTCPLPGCRPPSPTLALETVPAQTVPLPRTAVGVAHFRTTARNLLCRACPDTMAAAVLHCATYPRQALTVPSIHWACKGPVSPSLASGSANQNVVP